MILEHNSVKFDIEMDHALSLDFDDDDGVIITTYLTTNGDDEAEEVDTKLSTLVDECLEFYKFDGNYQTLYCIIHEMERLTGILRDTAQKMEDNTLIEDLFDVDMDDLPEVDD